LIDRFAQHRHVIDIDADSWCDKERLEKQAHFKTVPPPPTRSR
jgi:hypothetical protein